MILTKSKVNRISFSGHDSFQCRQLWLKKGYDFVISGKSFNDEDAVVKLGVGKNMVSSIRYWMKAFNIIDDSDNTTEFGNKLFDDDNGYDPFLEDEGSLYLLHYQLVKTKIASIYSIIFNEFRKEKLFFDKFIFLNYLKRIQEGNPELYYNENTVAKDFNVFINMYNYDSNTKDVEDSFSGILSEIGLLKSIGTGKEEKFQIESSERDELPADIVLYSIIDNPNYGNSISLNSLEFDDDSPGSIFALSRSGLVNKISELVSEDKNLIFTDHAGIKELQFKSKSNLYSILDKYYGK